jgi:hypothetical protein
MNGKKYVNNKAYKEGYLAGQRSEATVFKDYLDAIIREIEDFDLKCKEIQQDYQQRANDLYEEEEEEEEE